MEVVDKMDENYLWVDSLCILHYDDTDNKSFINCMATIYDKANMTIIALCGEDAYAGLPGVREDKPRLRQQEIEIKDISMLSVMIPAGWDDVYNLGKTEWMTRAWTHQETLHSCRRLVFGRKQFFLSVASLFYARMLLHLQGYISLVRLLYEGTASVYRYISGKSLLRTRRTN